MTNESFESEENIIFKFEKLTNVSNYHAWARQMIIAIRTIKLYDFLHEANSFLQLERFSSDEWKLMIRIEKRNFEQNLQSWLDRNEVLVDKIDDMCDNNIQQLLDLTWNAKTTWDFLKKRFSSQNWTHKWFVLNRLKQINYVDYKNVSTYDVAFKIALKEIKNLNITMKNSMMIKIFNNLNSSFETFFTVKNNDARNIEKLFDLDEFITSIEQKKIEWIWSTSI